MIEQVKGEEVGRSSPETWKMYTFLWNKQFVKTQKGEPVDEQTRHFTSRSSLIIRVGCFLVWIIVWSVKQQNYLASKIHEKLSADTTVCSEIRAITVFFSLLWLVFVRWDSHPPTHSSPLAESKCWHKNRKNYNKSFYHWKLLEWDFF